MSKHEVYFDNHSKANKFPWSLYHSPLNRDLETFLRTNLSKGKKVLVIGPGDFGEFRLLESLGADISVLDIDPRVLEVNKSRHGDKIHAAYLVTENFDGYPEPGMFDVVYGKEVIEHLVNYTDFLGKISTILKPSGAVWLSTPNYGFFLLPFLESTVLELIARFSGFSRKDIHPTRFNENSLKSALLTSGFQKIQTKVTFLKLALTASAKKS